MEKVYTTIKQFFRDWAPEGQRERDQCFKPLVDAVERLSHGKAPGDVSVLVPGAGLGRLMWEFAHRGFRCQGNEWSSFMLFASNFILNTGGGPGHTRIFPFAHAYTNNMRIEDQLFETSIPDVDVEDIPPGTDFSMGAGSFLEIYDDAEWDFITSCFFIDATRNIIATLKKMYDVLKPGGYLVNIGPLLYHFDDSPEGTVELTLDEVMALLADIGFTLLEERRGLECVYNDNPNSMMHVTYSCCFFVAQKPNLGDTNAAPQGESLTRDVVVGVDQHQEPTSSSTVDATHRNETVAVVHDPASTEGSVAS